MMDESLAQNPNINNLVGHSAAGSAVLEKATRDNKYSTITYGAPIFDQDVFTKHNVIRKVNRHANMFDTVAMFDFGANRSFIPGSLNPHSVINAPRRNNNFCNNDFVSSRTKRNKF